MAVQMVFRIIFLLSTLEPFAQAAKLAKGSCQDRCGNVSIPYPFGMGAPHCYLDEWFAIDCDVTEPTGSCKPFLRNYGVEVLKIQLDSSTGLVKGSISNFGNSTNKAFRHYGVQGSPFMVDHTKNRFVAVGCNNFASIISPYNESVIMGGCMSVCDETGSVNASDCNGINCCQTAIPSGLGKFFNLAVKPINDGKVEESVKSAFLVDTEWFKENFRMPIPDDYPVALVIQWQINSSLFNSLGLSGNAEGSSASPTYHCSNQTAFGNNRSLAFICSCKRGYEGNPYLPEGCQDVDECADPYLNTCSRYLSYENGRSTFEKMGCKNTKGSYECYSIKNTRLRIKGIIIGVSTGIGVPFLLISGWGSYKVLKKVLKKRKMMKRKEKFFKQNGGLLLQNNYLQVK